MDRLSGRRGAKISDAQSEYIIKKCSRTRSAIQEHERSEGRYLGVSDKGDFVGRDRWDNGPIAIVLGNKGRSEAL